MFKQYHKDINKCESAEVTGWEDGQRTVTFGLALTIPAVVKKVVGALPARPWLWLWLWLPGHGFWRCIQ